MSYLGAAMCIISTAQQANPKVRGHREPFLEGEKILERAQSRNQKVLCASNIARPAPVDQVVNPGESPLNLVLLEVHLGKSC